MTRRKYGMVAVAALALVSAPAQGAENIQCMDTDYSDAELTSINRFIDTYGMDDWEHGSIPPEVEASVVKRAISCAGRYEWSPKAAEQAVYYRIGSLLFAAIDKHTALTPEQMSNLREVYSSADSVRLTAMMEPAVDAAFAGEVTPMPSKADISYLDQHITRRAGLPVTRVVTDYVGAWLLTKAMTDVPKSRFSNR